MTVVIETLVLNPEAQQLLEAAAEAGFVRQADLAEIVETHELDALETDALHRELEQRSIDIVEQAPEQAPAPPPPTTTYETTTDALQLFLREAGRQEWMPAGPAAGDVERIGRRLVRR